MRMALIVVVVLSVYALAAGAFLHAGNPTEEN